MAERMEIELYAKNDLQNVIQKNARFNDTEAYKVRQF